MRFRALPFALAVLILFSACDSGDSNGDEELEAVSGTYEFTEFSFHPDGSAVAPIVVLDTLDQAETSLSISQTGTFIFSYRLIGGGFNFLVGRVEASTRAVELSGDSDDASAYRAILLSPKLTLRRDPDVPRVLAATVRMTINPSLFSDRYTGIESMTGTLRLRLERR